MVNVATRDPETGAMTQVTHAMPQTPPPAPARDKPSPAPRLFGSGLDPAPASYDEHVDTPETQRVAQEVPRLLQLARQLAERGSGTATGTGTGAGTGAAFSPAGSAAGATAAAAAAAAAAAGEAFPPYLEPVTGKGKAREQIFLKRAQLVAELTKLGLPPMMDITTTGERGCEQGPCVLLWRPMDCEMAVLATL